MSQTERRSHPRVPVDLPLQLTLRDRTVTTRILDLSGSGIRFSAPKPLPLLSRVQLAIQLPERIEGGVTTPLAITGVVVRCDQTGETRTESAGPDAFDTAIYFEDLSEAARSQLSQFVASQTD